MPLQKIHLLLQLQRVRPVVVAFAEGDILAAAHEAGVGALKAAGGAAVDGDVVFAAMEEEADLVGVTVGVGLADLPRAVGGFVFADEDLDGEVRLLHEHAVEAVADEVGVLVGADLDRHHGLGYGLEHAVGILFNRYVLVAGFEFFEVHILKHFNMG